MGARVLVVDDSPTIRKVVSSILRAAAYDPVGAQDGAEAFEMLDREHVDLVLLDFVMPRMNGYQFCRALRAHDRLRHLPVVLMSAKSDKIRGQFVQQTGAVDAITKPFDARGLVAVVEGALSRHEEGRARPVPEANEMPEEESLGETQSPASLSPADLERLREARAPLEFGAAFAELLAPALRATTLSDEVVSRVSDTLKRAFTPATLNQLSGLLQSLYPTAAAQGALSGDISVFSVAEVLQMLDMQRLTGELRISTEKSTVTLFVREGHIDFASSSGLRGEFLIGRFLVEAGAISRESLESALAERGTPGPTGKHLLRLGLVDEKQMQDALMRQTTELVYEVARWKAGHFVFDRQPLDPEADRPCFDLHVGGLVMEGFRRVDEWRLIEGSIDFDGVLCRDEIAIARLGDDSRLTKAEREVLALIDGERTVREIVEAAEASSFVVCKILYQFVNSHLVGRSAA
jgi:DNA-binding response OmpR family regulator